MQKMIIKGNCGSKDGKRQMKKRKQKENQQIKRNKK